MSQGVACKCSNPRHVVLTRNANHSVFNGYRRTYSDYSLIGCKSCGRLWRSKAKRNDSLPDVGPEWPRKNLTELP
jgi:hypothetical protein